MKATRAEPEGEEAAPLLSITTNGNEHSNGNGHVSNEYIIPSISIKRKRKNPKTPKSFFSSLFERFSCFRAKGFSFNLHFLGCLLCSLVITLLAGAIVFSYSTVLFPTTVTLPSSSHYFPLSASFDIAADSASAQQLLFTFSRDVTVEKRQTIYHSINRDEKSITLQLTRCLDRIATDDTAGVIRQVSILVTSVNDLTPSFVSLVATSTQNAQCFLIVFDESISASSPSLKSYLSKENWKKAVAKYSIATALNTSNTDLLQTRQIELDKIIPDINRVVLATSANIKALQFFLHRRINKMVAWSHTQLRNSAYLVASYAKADVIIEIDDNHIFYPTLSSDSDSLIKDSTVKIDLRMGPYLSPDKMVTLSTYQSKSVLNNHIAARNVYNWNYATFFQQTGIAPNGFPMSQYHFSPPSSWTPEVFTGSAEMINPIRNCMPVLQYFPTHSLSKDVKLPSDSQLHSLHKFPRSALPSYAFTSLPSSSNAFLSVGFFALYLPVTLAGNHSTISSNTYRSFIASTLFSYVRVPSHPYSKHFRDNLGKAPFYTDGVDEAVKTKWHQNAMDGDDPSLQSLRTAEPCIVIAAPNSLKTNAHAVGGDEYIPTENTTRLLQDQILEITKFFNERKRDHAFDLQLRVRKIKKEQRESRQKHPNYFPIVNTSLHIDDISWDAEIQEIETLADIAYLLYMDMHVAGLITIDDVNSIVDWFTDLQISSEVEQTPEGPLNDHKLNPLDPTSSFLDPLRTDLDLKIPELPFRNSDIAIIVNFNWQSEPHTLLFLTTFYSLLFTNVAITSQKGILSDPEQFILRNHPTMYYFQCSHSSNGWTQQYCIRDGLKYYRSPFMHLVDSFSGVFYTADDMYSNFTQVFQPSAWHRAKWADFLHLNFSESKYTTGINSFAEIPFAARSFTSTNLLTTQQTWPLNEFWYPPAADRIHATNDTVYKGQWLPYFRAHWEDIKKLYSLYPQNWRDLLTLIHGKDHFTTVGIADMVYVPREHNQLEWFVTILDEEEHIEPTIFGRITSEVLLTPTVELATMLSGRKVIRPVDYERLSTEQKLLSPEVRAANPFHASVYTWLQDRSTKAVQVNLPTSPGKLTLNSDHLAMDRLRPICFDVLGFIWGGRDNYARLQHRIYTGEPFFYHPVKLSQRYSPPTYIWPQAMEHMYIHLSKLRPAHPDRIDNFWTTLQMSKSKSATL